jgi:hypothetical protein
MEGAVKKEVMVASSLDTEAAGQDNGYTISHCSCGRFRLGAHDQQAIVLQASGSEF